MMAHRYMAASMNNLHRDHNRFRHETPFDAYDINFEDFILDPRPRRLADPIYRSWDSRRPSIFEPRQTGKFAFRPTAMDAYNDVRSTSVVRPTKQALPFGRAMRKLFETLQYAEEFYSGFQSDFDNDVSSIKKYASAEVLADIWRLRVNGKRDSRTLLEDEEKGDDQQLRQSKGKFEDMQSMLAKDLRHAVEATTKEKMDELSRNAANIDTAKRMQRKVETAKEQITELFEKARMNREYCVALLGELDLLKGLIDLENERNKALYTYGQDGIEEEETGEDDDTWAN